MTNFRTYASQSVGLAVAAGIAASQVLATPAWASGNGSYRVAAADCYSVGEQVAAQYGGTLANASASTQGGRQVCVVVVVVPAKNGQRARRIEVVVPAG
jgi:hypothetical protein